MNGYDAGVIQPGKPVGLGLKLFENGREKRRVLLLKGVNIQPIPPANLRRKAFLDYDRSVEAVMCQIGETKASLTDLPDNAILSPEQLCARRKCSANVISVKHMRWSLRRFISSGMNVRQQILPFRTKLWWNCVLIVASLRNGCGRQFRFDANK